MSNESKKTIFIRSEAKGLSREDLGDTITGALDIIGEGIWVWEPASGRMYLSPGFYTMLGFSPDEFKPTIASWSDLFHPDERDTVLDELGEAINSAENSFDLEYRLKTKFGLYRWIVSKAKVVERDNQGKPLRVVGSNTDVTERKRAIRSLRESEERYRNLYEKSPLIYQSLDKEGYIIDVNASWIDAMGFSPREIIARWFGEFLVFRYRDQFKRDYGEICNSGGIKGLQYELQRKDKSRLYVELDINIAHDNQGNFLQSHCVIRDITKHKKIEESLQKLTDRLRNEQKDLTEKNIALKQILKHIEKDRKEYRHHLVMELEQSVIPTLKRLRDTVDEALREDIETVFDNLEAVLAKDIDLFREHFSHLTPRETEMCYLIRDGLTSKEISSELNLSVVTVHKHREQIRKKLDIANKRINLNSYLKSRMSESSFIEISSPEE